MRPARPHRIVAVSLKMYFDTARAIDYCASVAREVARTQALATGTVRAAVLPSFLAIPGAATALDGSEILLGAQDLCQADRGAFTGEVSGMDLKAAGCSVVEVGHAERRTIYSESDQLVSAKTKAAFDAGLIPLLCVGEPEETSPDEAAEICISQALDATGGATCHEVWLGYEPYWAIGAPRPAPTTYVASVARTIRENLADRLPRLSILYGGSAGPGLFAQLGGAVDGLFLGRFAHDPRAFLTVISEVAAA